jgi:hypothetical protein
VGSVDKIEGRVSPQIDISDVMPEIEDPKRGKWRNGSGGCSYRWEPGTCMKLTIDCMWETYSGLHLEIDSSKMSLITVKQAWI